MENPPKRLLKIDVVFLVFAAAPTAAIASSVIEIATSTPAARSRWAGSAARFEPASVGRAAAVAGRSVPSRSPAAGAGR